MAPKRLEIPLEDIHGLRTLMKRKYTHAAIAAYYTKKFDAPCSRSTISRRIETLNLKEVKENVSKMP